MHLVMRALASCRLLFHQPGAARFQTAGNSGALRRRALARAVRLAIRSSGGGERLRRKKPLTQDRSKRQSDIVLSEGTLGSIGGQQVVKFGLLQFVVVALFCGNVCSIVVIRHENRCAGRAVEGQRASEG